MTRVPLRAGVFALAPIVALALPLASASPATAQDDCTCDRSDMPFAFNAEPGPFSFWRGAQARIGVGFDREEQDGYLDVGAVVSQIVDDSPAAEAGLRVADIIVAVDGQDLMEPLDRGQERWMLEEGSVPVQRLMALARSWESDEPVELEILRDGDHMSLTVVPSRDLGPLQLRMREMGQSLRELGPRLRTQLRQLEGSPGLRVWANDGEGFDFLIGSSALAGIEMTEVNSRLGSYFGVESGVLVTEVNQESSLGLEAGDVILMIGDRKVETPRDVRRILGSYDDGEAVGFEIRRDGSTQTVAGTVEMR